MSHVVEIEVPGFTEEDVLATACQRLGLARPVHKSVKLFSENVEGLSVQLDGWRYPIVIDLANQKIRADNYNGRWGRIEELEKLQQAYNVELSLKMIRDSNQFASVEETVLTDGSIQIRGIEY